MAKNVERRAQARTDPTGADTPLSTYSVLVRPSYAASVARTVRLRDARRAQGFNGPEIWNYNSKTAGRSYAEDAGLRVPALHATGPLGSLRSTLDDVSAAAIKPIQGAGAKGVALLVSTGTGHRETFSGREVAPAELEEFLLTLHQDPEEPYLVEELILRPDGSKAPSYDWKMLCMGGRCELVIQIERNSPVDPSLNRFRYWTRDWEPVSVTMARNRLADDRLLAPAFGRELIAMAETVARGLPGPFLRVDLFEDERGPVFGEITPHPNGGKFVSNFYGAELDERLGLKWERAEAAWSAAAEVAALVGSETDD